VAVIVEPHLYTYRSRNKNKYTIGSGNVDDTDWPGEISMVWWEQPGCLDVWTGSRTRSWCDACLPPPWHHTATRPRDVSHIPAGCTFAMYAYIRVHIVKV